MDSQESSISPARLPSFAINATPPSPPFSPSDHQLETLGDTVNPADDPFLLGSKLQTEEHITHLRQRKKGGKKAKNVADFYAKQNKQIQALLMTMDQHIDEAQEEEDTNRLAVRFILVFFVKFTNHSADQDSHLWVSGGQLVLPPPVDEAVLEFDFFLQCPCRLADICRSRIPFVVLLRHCH